MKMRRNLYLTIAAALSGNLMAAVVDFEAFYIRNSNSSIISPWDSNLKIIENSAGDGFSAATPLTGQKVGYGTSAFDGLSANKLQDISFTILGASGKSPYLNLWVSNGTKFAILAVDPNLNNVNFLGQISDAGLYEYEGKSGTAAQKQAAAAWLFKDGQSPTFTAGNGYFSSPFSLSSLQDTIVLDDPSDYPGAYVGTGAPRGGFGFNLIFGDTAANYIGTMSIENLKVTFDGQEYSASNNVPDSGSTLSGVLLAAGLIGWIIRRRV